MQAAFNVNLATFAEVFANHVGELAPYDNAMPLCAFLFLSLFVDPVLTGGDTQARHSLTLPDGFNFRICPQTTDDNDFINS